MIDGVFKRSTFELVPVDEEGEHYKSLIESRKKYLQELELEHDTLKMKNFELLDENYSLTKNKEDALEILSEAKKISALLSVSCF